MSISAVLQVIVAAMLVDNIIAGRFLGLCPSLCVYHKPEGAIGSLGAGTAVTVAVVLVTLLAWPLNHYLLLPHGVGYLAPMVFVLFIAVLSHVLGLLAQVVSPDLANDLKAHGPFVIVNSATLGVALLTAGGTWASAGEPTYGVSLLFGLSSGVGYLVVLLMMGEIRERLALFGVPKTMTGIPVTLVTAGLISLAFMGFAGLPCGLK
jgi:Na+-translocating ferredoxin:NAD+ oxidoreductase subunit A